MTRRRHLSDIDLLRERMDFNDREAKRENTYQYHFRRDTWTNLQLLSNDILIRRKLAVQSKQLSFFFCHGL